ncbi:hypothetical protein BK147_26335 [Paenibacillus sp. FSL R7-0337]|nr:hypothetical protein BK147_26335 [Paenibacillus sp. FSL R7-0337]
MYKQTVRELPRKIGQLFSFVMDIFLWGRAIKELLQSNSPTHKLQSQQRSHNTDFSIQIVPIKYNEPYTCPEGVTMSQPYNREIELRDRFNHFIADKITGGSEDYYSKLSVEDFEDLKTTLRDIHNIITYRTTIRFIEWVSERFPYVRENYQVYLDQVLNTKPSDNGYDLVVTGDINVIAEIKCNKPINDGYKFGSAQKTGIVKDLRSLLEGKSKAKSVSPNTAFKFLVIYDFGEHTMRASHNLIKNLPDDLKGKVGFYGEGMLLSQDHVYLVFLK